MSSQEPLTRGAIMSRTGISRDVMTYWVRYGVLRPLDPTARNFLFEWYDANIAGIMNQLRILGVRIEGMQSIARVYREAIAYFDGLGLNRDEVHALWSLFTIENNILAEVQELAKLRAIAAAPGFDPEKQPRIARAVADYADYSMEEEYDAKVMAASREVHGAQRVTAKVAEIRTKVTKEDFDRHLDPYLTITEQPQPGDPGIHSSNPDEMTYFWRVGEGDDFRFKWGGEAADLARQDGATAIIAVDVTAILYKVWNGEEGKNE